MENPSETIDGEAPRVLIARVSVSDQHLSAGPQSPLEDFLYDAVFDGFITKILAEYGHADQLVLDLMGDCFDPLAMPWKGTLQDPPYETVAVRKMRTIIRGHKMYFDALTRFLCTSNTQLAVFVGNHDHFLVFSRVQREIVRRIAHGNAELASRIRFVDQHVNYEEYEDGVLRYHGQNADAHNIMDPKTAILTNYFGVKLKRPMLNKPLGSHMAMELSARLKLKNPLIGRLEFERQTWQDAIRNKWGWAVFAGLMVLWFFYLQFIALPDFRRKVGLGTVLRVIAGTTKKDPVDDYATKRLAERNDVRVIILGHSHGPRRNTGPNGTYINTGWWGKRLKLIWPTFTYSWQRFRWLEAHWRRFRYFLETGKVPFARKLTKIIGYTTTVAVLVAYLFTSFDVGDWSVTLWQLKIVAGIVLGFTLLKAALRFSAVKPEVVEDPQFTFALVQHKSDGGLTADLMEYLPEDNSIRECV